MAASKKKSPSSQPLGSSTTSSSPAEPPSTSPKPPSATQPRPTTETPKAAVKRVPSQDISLSPRLEPESSFDKLDDFANSDFGNQGGYKSTKAPQQSGGEIVTLGNVETYIAKPADYPHSSARMLLLLTGGAGIWNREHQLLADRFAAAGFLVVMPDQFGNDPVPQLEPDEAALFTPNWNIVGKIKGLVKSWDLDRWIAYQVPGRIVPIVIEAVTHAINLYPDSVSRTSNMVTIPAVGVLLGAKNAACLASELESQLKPDNSNSTGTEAEATAASNETPSAPPFLVKTLALGNPTLLMSENLCHLDHGSAIQIINRHGDAILTDCPAPQANPYNPSKSVDVEAAEHTPGAEKEANESLPVIADLRAKGVKVDISMYDGSLPPGFILGPRPTREDEAQDGGSDGHADTSGAEKQEQATRKASEKAIEEMISFLRRNT